MDFNRLEQNFRKILELVASCPPNLQEKCFEMLLGKLLEDSEKKTEKPIKQESAVNEEQPKTIEEQVVSTLDPSDSSIVESGTHVKARKFLKDHAVTIEEINELFYKEGEELKPLFDNLQTTTLSESQIRLSLLEALKNGLGTGEFKFRTEDVRQLCDVYKCYDPKNFSANYKNSNALFTEQYEKNAELSLSVEGKKRLAAVIKQLAA